VTLLDARDGCESAVDDASDTRAAIASAERYAARN